MTPGRKEYRQKPLGAQKAIRTGSKDACMNLLTQVGRKLGTAERPACRATNGEDTDTQE